MREVTIGLFFMIFSWLGLSCGAHRPLNDCTGIGDQLIESSHLHVLWVLYAHLSWLKGCRLKPKSTRYESSWANSIKVFVWSKSGKVCSTAVRASALQSVTSKDVALNLLVRCCAFVLIHPLSNVCLNRSLGELQSLVSTLWLKAIQVEFA